MRFRPMLPSGSIIASIYGWVNITYQRSSHFSCSVHWNTADFENGGPEDGTGEGLIHGPTNAHWIDLRF